MYRSPRPHGEASEGFTVHSLSKAVREPENLGTVGIRTLDTMTSIVEGSPGARKSRNFKVDKKNPAGSQVEGSPGARKSRNIFRFSGSRRTTLKSKAVREPENLGTPCGRPPSGPRRSRRQSGSQKISELANPLTITGPEAVEGSPGARKSRNRRIVDRIMADGHVEGSPGARKSRNSVMES